MRKVTLDLETTGVDPKNDRIVEIAIVSDGEEWSTRVNPTVPIADGASKVHGITDAMVADLPTLQFWIPQINQRLAGCIIVGHNARLLDVPLLTEEFRRIGAIPSFSGCEVLDTLEIFKHHFNHKLDSAVLTYLRRKHVGAHGALADAAATHEVLKAQIALHDLPDSAEEINKKVRGNFVDADGKLVWIDGEVCLGFGKYNGVSLKKVDKGFLRWMLDKDFSDQVKKIIREVSK